MRVNLPDLWTFVRALPERSSRHACVRLLYNTPLVRLLHTTQHPKSNTDPNHELLRVDLASL